MGDLFEERECGFYLVVKVKLIIYDRTIIGKIR